MSEPKLSKFMRDALEQLSRHERRGNQYPFWWCRGSMVKLRALGLVEAWHPDGKVTKTMAHRLTEAGRAALSKAGKTE